MFTDLLEELRHTPLSEIGVASIKVKALAMLLWCIACVWAGQHWIVVPEQTRFSQQAAQLRDVTAQIATHNLRQTEIDELSEALKQLEREWVLAVQPFGATQTWSQSIAWAEAGAVAYGLEITIPMTQSLMQQPLYALNDEAIDQLNTAAIEFQVEGRWDGLISWFDQWIRHQPVGRVRIETLDVLQSEIPSRFVLRVTAQIWSHSNVDLKVDHVVPIDGVLRWVSGDQPWGIGLSDDQWWRALPFARLTLVGLGQINQAPFIWVLDPQQRLHAIKANETLSMGAFRLSGWSERHAHLMEVTTGQSVRWEMP